MPEVWKSVPGWEGFYEVSDWGNVRSVDRKIVNPKGSEIFYPGKPIIKVKRGNYYAVTLNKKMFSRNFRVHRLVAMAFIDKEIENKKLVVDHKDRNPINNRLDNLRIVSYRQNNLNKGLCKRNKSGYKGVHYHKQRNKWCAIININGKSSYIGLFDSPEEAGSAWMEKAKILRGDFA